MLSGYIQDMTALVMLKGWDSMMLVDRNDIWVNMKQIKGNVSDTSELDNKRADSIVRTSIDR